MLEGVLNIDMSQSNANYMYKDDTEDRKLFEYNVPIRHQNIGIELKCVHRFVQVIVFKQNLGYQINSYF